MEDCTCANCSTTFESESRMGFANATTPKLYSVDPCPECGKYELKKAKKKN